MSIALGILRILVDPAVLHAVQEIDDEADREPDDKPQVGHERERVDQQPAGNNAERRHPRDERAAERAFELRALVPENNHAERYDDERCERPDIDKLRDGLEREKPGDY